jgi:hypothetical protein
LRLKRLRTGKCVPQSLLLPATSEYKNHKSGRPGQRLRPAMTQSHALSRDTQHRPGAATPTACSPLAPPGSERDTLGG